MQDLIERNREKITELCRQHHVRSFSVFGSAFRDYDHLDQGIIWQVIRMPLPEMLSQVVLMLEGMVSEA